MPLSNESTPMGQFAQPDRRAIMSQLHKAGLLDFPELGDLKSKREVGAGNVPPPKTGMAPMVSSVPQADR
jgi:hypothetical protein